MTRRRYDTEALVTEIGRERRNAIMLILSGVAIIAFLVFYFTRISDSAMPSVPTSEPVSVAQKPVAPPPVVAPPPKPVEPPPAPLADPAVSVALGKAQPLWLDDKLVGPKVREHNVTLAPGKHTLRVKVGKKALEQAIDAQPGKRYVVTLDPKKKRFSVEASAVGPVASAADKTP